MFGGESGMGNGMGEKGWQTAAGGWLQASHWLFFPLSFSSSSSFFFSSVLFNQNFKLGSKQLFINLSGEAGISL